MGRDYCYIDLIVFDVEACFDKLKALLSRYPGRKFYLSDFRKNGEIYSLSAALLKLPASTTQMKVSNWGLYIISVTSFY